MSHIIYASMNRVSIDSDNGLSPSTPSHYLNQCWVIINWTLGNKLQWNFNQNTRLFIHENASENIICEMAAILSRGDELTHRGLNKTAGSSWKRISSKENGCPLIPISLKFVPMGPLIKSIGVQVMVRPQVGAKPFPKPLMTNMSDVIGSR